jgi:uncharacterized protein (TIGR02246 family)
MSMLVADNAEIHATTDAWVSAFNAHDVARIAGLYDPAAVFWGTLSPSIITSAQEVRAYFERAFSGDSPPTVTLDGALTRRFGDVAVSSGGYTLAFWVNGVSRRMPARFSFTCRKTNAGWLIVDHHSSLVPVAAGPS